MKRLNKPYLTGGLVVGFAVLLFLFTLDNGLRPDELTGGDLITHQYAQVEARPSNAPGYPLYTMGGWLWFRAGTALLSWVLNPIQILSFYSTLWGLASLVILYLILLDLGKRHPASRREYAPASEVSGASLINRWRLVALLLTLFYATTFFFWYYSVTTEQYTSAVFQTLLIIWLAFKWDKEPRDSTLLWLAFISGTMLANMITTLFILPPLLWFIFFRRADQGDPAQGNFMLVSYLKRPKFILQAVGLALLPLLSYAFIYIRGAQHPEWQGQGNWPTTWDWFIQFLTIQQGRDELTPGLSLQNIFTDEFPALMGWEFTWLVFWGGLLGLAFLGRRRAIFLYSTLVIYFFFSWGYRFGNWFQVIIPAYPIFIIGAAAAIKRFSDWLLQHRSSPQFNNHGRFTRQFIIYSFDKLRTSYSSFIIYALLALLIYRLTTSYPDANQRNRPTDTGLDPGWAIMADQPNSPAVIAGDFEERVALEYLRSVWDVEPNIVPIDAVPDLHPSQKNDRLYISRRASIMVPEVIESGTIYPQAAGEQLIALADAPLTRLPVTANRLSLDFGDTLQLAGWEQLETKADLPAQVEQRLSRANWQIALYWQTATNLDHDYTISVRPLIEGQLILAGAEAVIQDHQPVWGTYPTSRWQPTELVKDVFALTLPSGLTPDAVQIVVYETTDTGFENLGEQTIDLTP